MNANVRLHKGDAVSAGAVPEVKTHGLTVVVAAVVITVCLAGAVALTLSLILDEATAPNPSIRDAVSTPRGERWREDRHASQPGIPPKGTAHDPHLRDHRSRQD